MFMTFHGALLRRSLSLGFWSGAVMSSVVSTAQWSDPCSFFCMVHFVNVFARSSETRTRSIVVSAPQSYHVFVLLWSRQSLGKSASSPRRIGILCARKLSNIFSLTQYVSVCPTPDPSSIPGSMSASPPASELAQISTCQHRVGTDTLGGLTGVLFSKQMPLYYLSQAKEARKKNGSG